MKTLSIIMRSSADELPEVINRVEILAGEAGFGEREIMHVTSSLYEAITNAIEHGNRGDERKKVEVEAAQRGDVLEIRVRDEGGGFSRDEVRDPTEEDGIFEARGRGVLIMRKMMDNVSYNERGNEVTLKLARRERHGERFSDK